MSFPRHISLALVFLIASCVSQESASTSSAPHKDFIQQLESSQQGSYGYKRDSNGNWVPESNKMSSFASKGQDPNFTGQQMQLKSFHTKDYATKPWWGGKQLKEPTYKTTSTNFADKPLFDGSGKQASGYDSSYRLPKDYKTGNYKTKQASENNARQIPTPSDAETNYRRRVYPKPKIVDYEQQRKLSIEQSKKMMGR